MEWKEKVDGSGRGKGKNQAGYDWPVDQMRQWIEVDGLTQEIVGQKLGVSPKLVHKACKRFGIQCQRRGPRGGAGHPNWEGGRHSDKNGYILVHRPGHPMARSLGSSHKPAYVLEHRLVMAEYLGRMLEPYEVVHHKNADVTDNRIENLELYTSNAQHLRDELTGRVGNPIMGFMETPTIIPLAALERIMILRTMKQYPNMKDAAKVLGIGKTTLYRKLKEYKEKGKM